MVGSSLDESEEASSALLSLAADSSELDSSDELEDSSLLEESSELESSEFSSLEDSSELDSSELSSTLQNLIHLSFLR